MTMEAAGSYLDHLRPDEQLHRSIEDVCVQLEKEGWRVRNRTQRALRYWCPTSRCGKHQLWVDLEALTDERLSFQLARSCFTFG
jgi:hypothetical protein